MNKLYFGVLVVIILFLSSLVYKLNHKIKYENIMKNFPIQDFLAWHQNFI